jgi:PAS domain S-box-containing protein
VVPPTLVIVVVIYQLGITQALERSYGHVVHYGFEIGFYSLLGPVVTLLTLTWVEHRLIEQEKLEREFQARTRQLASLTEVSADAILTLDYQEMIETWNRGAKQIFGYQESEIIGQPLTKILPELNTLAGYWQSQGEIKNVETIALAKNHRNLAVELSQTRLAKQDDASSTASLIIMRDITARREREAIREEERARIARDLHDGVAQTLYFMALKTDMARRQLEIDPKSVSDELREIGRTARQVIREVRRTIFALRPLDWAKDGFLPALEKFVTGFAEQADWQLTIDLNQEELNIPAQLEPTIFRLVQESLNNVAKHAEATHVKVTLMAIHEKRELVLTIKDDGYGFDPSTSNNKGLGMEQMEARVHAIGGTIFLDSSPDKGTMVTANLPATGDLNG